MTFLGKVSEEGSRLLQDQRVVKAHGYIWIFDDEYDDVTSLYSGRSLATGYKFMWFGFQMEVNDEKADQIEAENEEPDCTTASGGNEPAQKDTQ